MLKTNRMAWLSDAFFSSFFFHIILKKNIMLIDMRRLCTNTQAHSDHLT